MSLSTLLSALAKGASFPRAFLLLEGPLAI